MAVATPAMLPVPTRLAVDTISAWNDEMERSPSTCFFSVSCLNMSLMKRICTPFVRMVKYTPTATSRISRIYVYMKPSISPVTSTSHALKSMWLSPSRTEFHPGNVRPHKSSRKDHYTAFWHGRERVGFAKPRLASIQNRRKNAKSNANNLARLGKTAPRMTSCSRKPIELSSA